jgi:hypothetical protein
LRREGSFSAESRKGWSKSYPIIKATYILHSMDKHLALYPSPPSVATPKSACASFLKVRRGIELIAASFYIYSMMEYEARNSNMKSQNSQFIPCSHNNYITLTQEASFLRGAL